MSAAAWPRPRVPTALVGALLALAGCGPTAVVDRRADGRAILIRSPQPDADDLAELAAREGVRTVVNLRGAAPGEAWFEEERRGVEAIGARWVQHETSGRAAPGPRWVETTLALLSDEAAWPILVHCEGGVHRTGLVVALYRMAIQGWSAARAIEELEDEWFDWTLVDRDAIRRFLRRGVGAAGNSPPRVPSPSPPDASPAAEEDDGWPGTKTPPPATPLECYEIHLPYRDPIEARLTGQPADATLSVVVRAWASDVEAALASAREWFATLRLRRGCARLVDAAPVVRRLATEVLPRAA